MQKFIILQSNEYSKIIPIKFEVMLVKLFNDLIIKTTLLLLMKNEL